MQTALGDWTKVPSNEVLDLAVLRPGDIILSRPKGLESALIALFGRSDFSHAQLVVADDCLGPQYEELEKNRPAGRQKYTLVIEATTDFDSITKQIVGGVGYRRLPQRYLGRRGMSPFQSQTVSLLSSYLHFDVFRHRAADTAEFRAFITERIPELCQRYEHQPYASLRDLAQVSAMPLTVETLGNLLKTIPQSPRPGLFCSQLVASIFADGRFPLTQGPPARMRPRDLALASTMECITPSTRIVVEEDAVIRNYRELLKEVFPDMLTDIERKTTAVGLADFDEMLEVVGEEGDFGRTIAWGLRDRVDAANDRRAQMEQIIASIDGLAAMAARVLRESLDSCADVGRGPSDGA